MQISPITKTFRFNLRRYNKHRRGYTLYYLPLPENEMSEQGKKDVSLCKIILRKILIYDSLHWYFVT